MVGFSQLRFDMFVYTTCASDCKLYILVEE